MADVMLKIILAGDSGVGKTNIIGRFCDSKFKLDSTTTLGVEFNTKNIDVTIKNRQQKANLQIWDTAGQEEYRAMTTQYYRGSHGALLIYDLTRHSTFEKCEQWIKDIH